MRTSLLFWTAVCITAFYPATGWMQTAPQWTWIGGATTADASGVYGAQGTFAAGNRPGARENAMTWTDASGHLWLFGGHGYNNGATQGYLNDLWQYDPALQQWAWMHGSSAFDQAGVYGTQNTPSATNTPGARQNSVTWTDDDGNLWLFGGQKSGANQYFNDLWKYSVTTHQWTWVSGGNTINELSVYGTQGTPAPANRPGARYGSAGWKGSGNTLWLFGGQQYTSAQERVNDLWRFDIGSGQWTWMAGSSSPNQNGNYGTMGNASPTNVPGARQACLTWRDGTGNFWLFGGYGYAASGSASYLDDLWKFDPVSGQWTWIWGSDQINQPAVYGTQGSASASNNPGARQMSVSWTDASGNFWLFGGWGYGGPPFGRMSDLWKYTPAGNTWTWMNGPSATDQPGTYGVQNTSSPLNNPGARRMAVSWTDGSNCWLFGGNGYDENDSLGLLNDLWKINLSGSSGMNEEETLSFSLYPNPASDIITLSAADAALHHIEVMDMQGRRIYSGMLLQSLQIPVHQWKPGVYNVRVEGRRSYPFIKR